ncbi:hypothetical protein C3L33_04149, partial [Rhododendron williamsianum]
MALGQTLALPKAILLCTPRNPLIPSSSLSPNPPIRLFSSPSQTTINNRRFSAVKCALTYNNNNDNGQEERVAVPQYPRPTEIPWQKEICNTVHLIGYVTTVVQIRYLPDGRAVAVCRIAVSKSPLDTSSILLSFWNELAHAAFQHLEKGTQIYVCGRLIADTVETEDGTEQTYYKVNVKQLNFIERSWDSNSETPGKKISSASREELWQAFFANPADCNLDALIWTDAQRPPRYPDFKHKHTGEALWVEGRFNPPWVKSQLEILDARREAFGFQDQNGGMNVNFGAGNDYSTL